MLNRDEDMVTSGQRHPFLGLWEAAVTKEGKVQALDADVFCNAGMYHCSLFAPDIDHVAQVGPKI